MNVWIKHRLLEMAIGFDIKKIPTCNRKNISDKSLVCYMSIKAML